MKSLWLKREWTRLSRARWSGSGFLFPLKRIEDAIPGLPIIIVKTLARLTREPALTLLLSPLLLPPVHGQVSRETPVNAEEAAQKNANPPTFLAATHPKPAPAPAPAQAPASLPALNFNPLSCPAPASSEPHQCLTRPLDRRRAAHSGSGKVWKGFAVPAITGPHSRKRFRRHRRRPAK